ncbi:hypothetical protein ONS95_007031 [Cadophora gregata]|uniref:uncharacterized protein n=1 Tax=Cadophora gregata TaxID=51156 RepID=UPI0026DAEA26|nr:uncharacterized protein ONS95_007031 [Cadophora gregata]KAK0100573.1 hypothetical protein ONS95_007031 [Cadophora gregata]KAK0117428.1 hypothetical protein ONS96_013258 [Cadophora gregata f. sp. sojae]
MASLSFMDWVSSVRGAPAHAAGSSPLERLPAEILTRILLYVAAPTMRKGWDIPHALPGEHSSRPNSLLPTLQISHRIHDIAIFIMYRDPNIRTPKVSSITRFFETLDQNPSLSTLIRTFDITRSALCGYTLTLEKISRLPRLRDLRLSLSHVKDVRMLQRLMFGFPSLQALTLDVSCLSEKTRMLRGAFEGLPGELESGIESLRFVDGSGAGGLHIPGVLESLLPRMRKLRVLDVSRTCVTVDALVSIPSTARLTHLNVWGCRDLELDELVNFLISHPAVKDSLVVLKAGYIADGAPLNERQINTFLSQAPPTLRSLDLSMSSMGPSNIPYLQKLCSQLEELSVGQNFDMYNIESMILKPRYDFDDEYRSCPARELTKEEAKHEAILEPMRNAVAMCRLRRRLSSVTVSESREGRRARGSTLRYLNLSSIPAEEQGMIKQSVLFGRETGPLEVVELANIPWEDFEVLGRVCGAVGWREEWEDKRVWVERL